MELRDYIYQSFVESRRFFRRTEVSAKVDPDWAYVQDMAVAIGDLGKHLSTYQTDILTREQSLKSQYKRVQSDFLNTIKSSNFNKLEQAYRNYHNDPNNKDEEGNFIGDPDLFFNQRYVKEVFDTFPGGREKNEAKQNLELGLKSGKEFRQVAGFVSDRISQVQKQGLESGSDKEILTRLQNSTDFKLAREAERITNFHIATSLIETMVSSIESVTNLFDLLRERAEKKQLSDNQVRSAKELIASAYQASREGEQKLSDLEKELHIMKESINEKTLKPSVVGLRGVVVKFVNILNRLKKVV